MAVDPSVEMVAFVRRRIDALLTAPDAWGSPESVELQLLLLVEMWHVVVGSPREDVDAVTDRYQRYLAGILPGPPVPLALRLGLSTRSDQRFADLLQGFVEAERAERGLTHPAGVPVLPARDQGGPVHIEA